VSGRLKRDGEPTLGRRVWLAEWLSRPRACWQRRRRGLTPISWQRLDVAVDGALVVVRHVTDAGPRHRRQAGAGAKKLNPLILRVCGNGQPQVLAIAGAPRPRVRFRAPLEPLCLSGLGAARSSVHWRMTVVASTCCHSIAARFNIRGGDDSWPIRQIHLNHIGIGVRLARREPRRDHSAQRAYRCPVHCIPLIAPEGGL